MSASGTYSLGDISVTLADTYVGSWRTSLDGVGSVTAQLRFAYGSGGSTARAYLQTSLDQGETAIDVACILFTTVSDTAIFNFSSATPSLFSGSPPLPLVPTDAAMADDTAVLDGIIGDRFRVKIVTTGTYATQTLLSGRITVR